MSETACLTDSGIEMAFSSLSTQNGHKHNYCLIFIVTFYCHDSRHYLVIVDENQKNELVSNLITGREFTFICLDGRVYLTILVGFFDDSFAYKMS